MSYIKSYLIRLIVAKLQKSQAGYPVFEKVFERRRNYFLTENITMC